MTQEKPFTTLNHPLIVEHMRRIVTLEAELSQQEGFNPAMIIEYHLQLACIALVTASEYNPETIGPMFTSACEQLKAMCHEEMENQPVNLTFPSNNETVH